MSRASTDFRGLWVFPRCGVCVPGGRDGTGVADWFAPLLLQIAVNSSPLEPGLCVEKGASFGFLRNGVLSGPQPAAGESLLLPASPSQLLLV